MASVAPDSALGGRLRAWAILLFAGGTWGVTFSLAKIATEGGAHPLGITLWQAIIGSLLLLVYVFGRRQGLPLDRAHLSFYLVCGLLGTAIPGTLYFYAADKLPAGVLSITIATVPIMTFLAAALLRVERLSIARLLGVALGTLSIVMIAGPETSLPDRSAAPWVLAAVAAAACYAVENLYIAVRRPAGSNAATVLCGMLLMASLVLAPVVVLNDSFASLAWPWGEVELAIMAMALINLLSYGLFVYLVTSAGPVFASLTAYVVTLSGVIWGIAIFGEQHSAWIWGALLVMMVGLTLVKPRATR